MSGVTYVPVRAAGELLKKYVTWDAFIKAVYINNQMHQKVLYFPAANYPLTAAHMRAAIGKGKSPICTIDRAGADANRANALQGIPAKEGFDRDEYPMAMCAEGGTGADVAYVKSSDNRGSGSWIGNQLEPYPEGTRVLFVIDGAGGASPTSPSTPATPSTPVTYENCAAVKAAGKAPLYKGQPGYSTQLDRDGDGVACEQ